MTSFLCSLGKESYGAGGFFTALLRKCDEEGLEEQAIATVQAFGHISVDKRWIKTRNNDGTELFSQLFEDIEAATVAIPRSYSQSSSGASVNVSKGIPADGIVGGVDKDGGVGSSSSSNNNLSPSCIFATPIVPIANAASTLSEGVLVQMDLPSDLLATFKGLYLTVNYFIQLAVFSPTTKIHTRFIFPFTVSGTGSSSTKPYHIRFSSLSVIPFSSLPVDNVFNPLPDASQQADEDAMGHCSPDDALVCHPVTFNIRDEELVCSVCLLLPSSATASDPHIKLYAGNTYNIGLSFHLAKQSCHSVKSRLVQCEKRIDGTRVQDKVLVNVTRNTRDAVSINLQLQVPTGIACDFSCPILNLSHVLEVEFFVEPMESSRGESTSVDPQTWSIPVIILPQKRAISTFAELNACLEPLQVLRASQ